MHSFRHSLEEKRHEDKYADEYLEEVRQALGNHVREGHPESESGSVSHRQYATALQSDDQVLSVVFNPSTTIPKIIIVMLGGYNARHKIRNPHHTSQCDTIPLGQRFN